MNDTTPTDTTDQAGVTDVTPAGVATEPIVDPAPAEPAEPTDAGEAPTYPAEYVKELRAEAAEHRTKAKALQLALVSAWATVDGRLVDPSDLPVASVQPDDDGNYTRQAVTAAIDALLASKPHLGAARPAPLPQGARPEAEQVSLLGLLNRRP